MSCDRRFRRLATTRGSTGRSVTAGPVSTGARPADALARSIAGDRLARRGVADTRTDDAPRALLRCRRHIHSGPLICETASRSARGCRRYALPRTYAPVFVPCLTSGVRRLIERPGRPARRSCWEKVELSPGLCRQENRTVSRDAETARARWGEVWSPQFPVRTSPPRTQPREDALRRSSAGQNVHRGQPSARGSQAGIHRMGHHRSLLPCPI